MSSKMDETRVNGAVTEPGPGEFHELLFHAWREASRQHEPQAFLRSISGKFTAALPGARLHLWEVSLESPRLHLVGSTHDEAETLRVLERAAFEALLTWSRRGRAGLATELPQLSSPTAGEGDQLLACVPILRDDSLALLVISGDPVHAPLVLEFLARFLEPMTAVLDHARAQHELNRLRSAVLLGRPVVARAAGAARSAPAAVARATKPGAPSPESLDAAMKRHIERALTATRGRIEGHYGAARLLKVNPHTLRARMRKLGIEWRRFRQPDPLEPE